MSWSLNETQYVFELVSYDHDQVIYITLMGIH
jgi:hypothetical protein